MIKLNRRSAIISGCLCMACSSLPSTKAWADEEETFICSSRPLPDDDPEVAAYSAGVPDIASGPESEYLTTPFGVATAKKRWRTTDGLTKNSGVITLGVFFMNGEQGEHDSVMSRANKWIDGKLGKKLEFRVVQDASDAQIRVHLDKLGPNNSAIGRDAIHSSFKGLPTMRIANMRSVAHEFGHALCLRHEHRHEEFPYKFKEETVIAEMRKPPNKWSATKTRRNILNPISGSKCVGDKAFNEDSVMIYQIPRRWLEEGGPIRPNRNISKRDRSCVYSIYEA